MGKASRVLLQILRNLNLLHSKICKTQQESCPPVQSACPSHILWLHQDAPVMNQIINDQNFWQKVNREKLSNCSKLTKLDYSPNNHTIFWNYAERNENIHFEGASDDWIRWNYLRIKQKMHFSFQLNKRKERRSQYLILGLYYEIQKNPA